MAFEKAVFIKPDIPFHPAHEATHPAPLMRRRFTLGSFRKAELAVCALGYGEFYLNGRLVTEDKFIAPVSDYTKTLWYTVYDVTDLLAAGENVFAAVLGNGWYNEPFKTSWDYDTAPWRDLPKLLMELKVDGEVVVCTGEGWRCKPESAIVYNELRSGEHFDARLHLDGWNALAFDDSSWAFAAVDSTPPTGVLRECLCPPIREKAVYPAKTLRRTGERRWVFDIGQNISGYVRLHACQPSGTELVIRYSEELNADGSLQLNNMFSHYKESEFMTDRFLCDGKMWVWSPRFAYHGFRYVEITGVVGVPSLEMVEGVFVHQDVAALSGFVCSDETVNRLFELGQFATLSNLFYMPTDCPTREKLGWCNDAQASCEQMLLDFDTADFFRKWLQDIYDAMTDEGALPGVIPTSGWGYEWGNGPVSDGILFEIPHQLYHFTGDRQPLVDSLPYFRRYLNDLDARTEEDGLIHFGLNDWAPPTPDQRSKTPATFINAVLRIKFLRIAALAASLAGDDSDHFEEKTICAIADFQRRFLNEDGSCNVETMTAAAMVIAHELYADFDGVKKQLMAFVEECDFHHDCGMVGLPRLYPALDACGLSDWALRILTAKGYPGYVEWLDRGATTLWETWQCKDSHNHHMYSSFMAWLVKTPGGIHLNHPEGGELCASIEPAFVSDLDWVDAHRDTPKGRIRVCWMRTPSGVSLRVAVPDGMPAVLVLGGEVRPLASGETEVCVKG